MDSFDYDDDDDELDYSDNELEKISDQSEISVNQQIKEEKVTNEDDERDDDEEQKSGIVDDLSDNSFDNFSDNSSENSSDLDTSELSSDIDTANHEYIEEINMTEETKTKKVTFDDFKGTAETDEIKLFFKKSFDLNDKLIFKREQFKFGSLPPSFNFLEKNILIPKDKIPITRYQFTRLIGFRLTQLSQGCVSYAYWDSSVIEPTSLQKIKMEIEQDRLPLLIAYINPDKTLTCIRVKDFDFSSVYFDE